MLYFRHSINTNITHMITLCVSKHVPKFPAMRKYHNKK